MTNIDMKQISAYPLDSDLQESGPISVQFTAVSPEPSTVAGRRQMLSK